MEKGNELNLLSIPDIITNYVLMLNYEGRDNAPYLQ